MQINKAKLEKSILWFFALSAIVFTFILLANRSVGSSNDKPSPVSYVGDTQFIDLTAKGGFSPSVLTANAGAFTILKVTTKQTFDCSSSIRIPSMDISQNLPLNGTTDIALGVHKAGDVVDGTCLMGMYSFKIKFI